MAPSTQQQWTVGGSGFDTLEFKTDAPVAQPSAHEVLVKFHAASLNYRDLLIAKGEFGFPWRKGVVPGSDGAGVVEAVGEGVTRFKVGDKVNTIFNTGHLAGRIEGPAISTGVGGMIDGSLRQYGVYNEQIITASPSNLSFEESASLTCAAVTAWNSLYGLDGRQLQAGDWVLTQGTGGVSLFAVQFAKAAGARVIATTSSNDKANTLKKLGADHIINYKETENWGEEAKKISGGVHHVIEVGGPATLAQSLKAVRLEGVISLIGFLGGFPEGQPTLLETLMNTCTVRGIMVGSRLQFEDMTRAIEANNIHPVLDSKVFNLDQIKDAYQYMWDQKNFGKMVVKIA